MCEKVYFTGIRLEGCRKGTHKVMDVMVEHNNTSEYIKSWVTHKYKCGTVILKCMLKNKMIEF